MKGNPRIGDGTRALQEILKVISKIEKWAMAEMVMPMSTEDKISAFLKTAPRTAITVS